MFDYYDAEISLRLECVELAMGWPNPPQSLSPWTNLEQYQTATIANYESALPASADVIAKARAIYDFVTEKPKAEEPPTEAYGVDDATAVKMYARDLAAEAKPTYPFRPFVYTLDLTGGSDGWPF